MNARILWLALGLCGTSLAADSAQPPLFSAGGMSGWTPESIMHIKETSYAVAEDGGVKVIEARCDSSASMVGWAGPVDLKQTPVLSWRWKIEHIYPGLNEKVREGSDFPARIYVVAGKRWMPWTLHTLEYAWANGESKEASWLSPYSGLMGAGMIVPVRSGADGQGQWQEQQRDVQADFKKFFNLDIDSIGAVAIMSDCDDSKSTGHAWFGDMHFLPRADAAKP
jgi:hypothetical protein